MRNRVAYFLSIFMVFIGASLCIPVIFALVYGEMRQAGAFLLSALICFIPGSLLKIRTKQTLTDSKIGLRDSYFLVAISWLLASLFGCLPFLLSGITDNFFLAFFETVSGFSTTGATIFTDVESLPRSILIWRALTQWLGGMGMIVLFFALLPKFGAKANTISRAETPGAIQTRTNTRYTDTARHLYTLYIAFTIVLMILLMFGGMSPFDSLAHSLTTVATGGFSTRNNGLAYYNSAYIYWVIAFFALIAGTNFTLLFDILNGKIKKAFRDEELRAYLFIVIISIALITISLKHFGFAQNATDDLSAAAFQVINTISTLGFETGHSNWPSFCIMLLMCLMITGGCGSSTAGGVKVARVTTLFKVVKRELNENIHETVVDNISYNGSRIQKDTLDYILSFVVLYISIVGISVSIISFFGGGEIMSNLFSILSCISNLGPGFDNLGLNCTYFVNSPMCVIAYTFVMIAGRLELTTLLVLFSKYFWNPYKV